MYKRAFTIIELLVVIVVIGILTSITLVSYSGITQKATAVSLQADLANNSKLLRIYQTLYGSYPNLDVNNCPVASGSLPADTNYCLKKSGGNSVDSYTTNGTTFTLKMKNGNLSYAITDVSSPYVN